MRTPRLLFCLLLPFIIIERPARATLAPPCEWAEALPKGKVTIRGLLQIARYHASPKSRRWSKAYLLMPTKGGCTVQVEASKQRLAPCDGYIVELVGPVRYGGAVADFTLSVGEIRCLHPLASEE